LKAITKKIACGFLRGKNHEQNGNYYFCFIDVVKSNRKFGFHQIMLVEGFYPVSK